MDHRSTEQQRKQQLIARLDASRAQIHLDRQSISDKLHPIRRIRGAVKNNPLQAFGIAAGSAFLISLLRHRSSSSRPTTFKRRLFRWSFNLAKPAIRLWLLKQVKERFLSSQRSAQTDYQANTP
jgi:hypothetical protein